MEENYKVYRHITPDGKSYIGVTKLKLRERFQNGRGYKKCAAFEKAINKYGWDNIQHEILCSNLSKDEAYKKEIEYIELFKTTDIRYGYNIEKGGLHLYKEDNSFYGKHHTKEARKKISEKHKGKTPWNKGVYGEINKTTKKVICIETGNVYESTRDVERKLHINHANVSRCCNKVKKYKTAGGFHWEYYKDANL